MSCNQILNNINTKVYDLSSDVNFNLNIKVCGIRVGNNINTNLNDSNNISDQTNNGKQILNKLNFRQKLVTKKEQCCK